MASKQSSCKRLSKSGLFFANIIKAKFLYAKNEKRTDGNCKSFAI